MKSCKQSILYFFCFSLFLSSVINPCNAESPIDKSTARADKEKGLLWYDVQSFQIEGKGWKDTQEFCHRLPAKAENFTRPKVWRLSTRSAGIAARFTTNATDIYVNWKLTSDRLSGSNMAPTGASGIDCYLRTKNGWRWVACGRPSKLENTATFLSKQSAEEREFMIYLPLFNGVTSLEIGIPKDATISKGPARPKSKQKPIVFYGTSITHGASATRPGSCHVAILGRRFDRPVINLGFAGNGMMDLPLAPLFAEIDAEVFVFDCVPNCKPSVVRARAEKFIRIYRKARPNTPILMVEDRTYADSFIKKSRMDQNIKRRIEYKKVYAKLKAEGFKNLHYLEGDKLLSKDGEDTVDGSHPTDLGFFHQANAFEKALRPMIGK